MFIQDMQAKTNLGSHASPSGIGSSNPNNLTYPEGSIMIDPEHQEICGSNPERQDYIIAPVSTPGVGTSALDLIHLLLRGCVAQRGSLAPNQTGSAGTMLSAYAYATFRSTLVQVNVRVAVSFISIDQARQNLEKEIPDGQSLEDTARSTRALRGLRNSTKAEVNILYGTLQVCSAIMAMDLVCSSIKYPYEQDEYGKYYSGYSVWDTYRAWLILLAPERIPGMVQSMIQDYRERVETNIMVATHANSLVAEAVLKGFTGFDLDAAWNTVYKDATVPPINDTMTS
ncbi:glycosyl hydrolase family 92-domain-containing protein [Boletus reticuloceps]|uniref:Glycosyl hydrolase family 92-domain-containing protein n=1 Tax=Boletus reticuloceps TaxID=495285 RepID=A0A8I3AAF7_9AGAM|nr:glycosyl hydrolase family 92-domain-containing protein [Boletus reticuloceps]